MHERLNKDTKRKEKLFIMGQSKIFFADSFQIKLYESVLTLKCIFWIKIQSALKIMQQLWTDNERDEGNLTR